MDTAGADAHFVDKWRAREPEMQFADVFCPSEEKSHFRAWGALLHELRETLFELSDPRVTAVKTGWWAEELIGIGQGRQRHPLSAALLGADATADAKVPTTSSAAASAAWSALGRTLLDHDIDAPRATDTEHAIVLLLPLAASVIALEAAIFHAQASAAAARSLSVHWLLQRLPRGLSSEDQARIPMQLFARHSVTPAQLASAGEHPLLRDWAAELSSAMPAAVAGSALIRRIRHRFDQARLARLASGKGFSDPPLLPTHWRAWRAARSR